MQTTWFTVLDTETGEKHNALVATAEAAQRSIACKLGGVRNGGDKVVVPGTRFVVQGSGETFDLALADASPSSPAILRTEEATLAQIRYLADLVRKYGYTARHPVSANGVLTKAEASAAIAAYSNPINW